MVQPVPKPRPQANGARRSCVLGEVHDNAVLIYVYESVLERILDYSENCWMPENVF